MKQKRFGRLTILKETDRPEGYKYPGQWYTCQCDCGTVKNIRWNSLQQGTQSCGCLQHESIKRGKEHPMYRHGHCQKEGRSKEWRAWHAMLRRVKYPSMDRYPRYGGRGIIICDRWLNSFEAFLEDVGPAPSPDHTLDRIDNDGDYEPDNVRWATRSEQHKNSSRACFLTHNGRTLNLCDWVKETGIKRTTIQMRLKYGWSVHDALAIPVGRKRNEPS